MSRDLQNAAPLLRRLADGTGSVSSVVLYIDGQRNGANGRSPRICSYHQEFALFRPTLALGIDPKSRTFSQNLSQVRNFAASFSLSDLD